jgi:hypothetical protein
MKKTLFLSTVVLSALVGGNATADIAFTGSYAQNFDTLASSGTPAWANDSTLPGWSLFNALGATVPTYTTGNGGTTTGSFYSFGATSSSERAFGGLASGGSYFGSPASGALAGYIAVALQNTSGGSFDSFTISFDGEQWRNGGNASAQTMQLQYGFGATFATVATWTTPGGTFDWASPIASTTAAAVDGNVAGLVASRGGTISSLTWNNTETLWIRWVENNDTGNDHGLAVDNFSITATAAPVPEPSVAAILGGFGILGLFMAARQRK